MLAPNVGKAWRMMSMIMQAVPPEYHRNADGFKQGVNGVILWREKFCLSQFDRIFFGQTTPDQNLVFRRVTRIVNLENMIKLREDR